MVEFHHLFGVSKQSIVQLEFRNTRSVLVLLAAPSQEVTIVPSLGLPNPLQRLDHMGSHCRRVIWFYTTQKYLQP